VTLDVDAVKDYQVIGGGVGQLLVQVDVDRERVPEAAQAAATSLGNIQTSKYDLKHPSLDKHPIFDKYPWEEPVKTPEKGWDNAAPFALSTPQQAPESALTEMQGAAGSSLKTVFWADPGATGYRDVYKRPWLDATGRPPYLD
jgi:hypothetical protein